MSFRKFFLGLTASFGAAWLAIIIIPYFKMRAAEPILMKEGDASSVYIAKRAGRIAEGAEVYAQNGCYQCHTQVVRPTYAGNDMFRSDWGGLAADEDRGDTRRETNHQDFGGESYAQIGVTRLGPDLSNLARRVRSSYAPEQNVSAETWLYRHLFNPRHEFARGNSTCPPLPFLFKEVEITGNAPSDGLNFGEEGREYIPGPDAKALVSYLLSLTKDQPVPASLDFSPKDSED